MQFTLPTTKQQMYQTLNEIFHYYRIKRETYEEVEMQELSLPDMTITLLTDEQLREKATTLVGEKHAREIFERKIELSAKIAALNSQMEIAEKNANANMEKISQLYTESQDKLTAQASKNGLINSSIYIDKFTYLENEMIEKINAVNDDYNETYMKLYGELSECETNLDSVEDFYSSVHEKAIDAKTVELKDEQEKLKRELFKYNNGILEKMQRYENTLLKLNADLKLKYLDVSAVEYTKDQLVEMGYYDDVIKCVCGYYDTLQSMTAYQDINADKKVPIYLDDYYQNIVYMYGVRAGVIG